MTSTKLTIEQSGTGAQAQGGNIVARVGPCSGGTPLQVFTFDPGQLPEQSVGYGAVVESTKRSLAEAKLRCLVVPTDNTEPGTFGAVNEAPSGPGPTPSLSSADGVNGPFDNFLVALKVTVGGAAGTARLGIALDGSTFAQNELIPAESPGSVQGLIDLKGIDTDAALHGLTIVLHNETDTTNRTVTFSHPANPAAVVSQANTVFTANGSHMVASLVSGRYLKLASAIGGITSVLTLVSGTALTALGLTAAAYQGSPSIIIVPGTNIKITCPATSAYVAGTVYTAVCSGPIVALNDVLDALDVLKDTYQDNTFSKIEITQPPADGAELRAWVGAIAARLLSWQAGDAKVFARACVGAPLGTPGPSGIAANDLDVRANMNGERDDLVDVAHGAVYLQGQAYAGSFRRSVVELLSMQFQGHSLSEDPGNATFGALPQASLTSPDYDATTGAGVIERDENTATTKLGGSAGPGFSVLKKKPDGLYFVRGVSRAGPASLFKDIGVVSMAYYTAAVIDQLLVREENTTRDVKPDGTMLDHERTDLENNWTQIVNDFVVKQGHASAAIVTLSHNDLVEGPLARRLIAKFKVQPRGQIEFVEGTLSIVGKLTLAA